MALTSRDKEIRRGRITASRAPAILGLSRYRSPADAYYEIVNELEIEPTSAMELGNRAEPMLLAYAQDRLGSRVDRRGLGRVDDELPWLSATLDGWLPDRPGEIVQAKTAGVSHYLDRDSLSEWGEDLTGDVPQEYIVQCQVELRVDGAAIDWMPALIGGVGLRLYRIERNERLIAAIVAALSRFYEKHILKRVPPEDSLPCEEILRQLPRVPGKVVSLPASLKAAYDEARAAVRTAQERLDQAATMVKAALGDAEGGKFEDGSLCTYMVETRRSYTVPEWSGRVLRWKQAKTEGEHK